MTTFLTNIKTFYKTELELKFYTSIPLSMAKKIQIQDIIDNIIKSKNICLKLPGLQLIQFPYINNFDFIKIIDIGHNKINNIPFNIPINIQNLNCEYNDFKDTFIVPKNILKITINSNKITKLKFQNNSKIININCNNNNISCIEDISKCKNIKFLSCNTNKLTYLDCSSVKLHNLNCSSNEINISTLNISSTLLTINISSNNFKGILDMRKCKQLKSLICTNNKITNIKLDSRLTTLCCSSNMIKYFIIKTNFINVLNSTSNKTEEAIIHFNFKKINLINNSIKKITFKNKIIVQRINDMYDIDIDYKTLKIVSPFYVVNKNIKHNKKYKEFNDFLRILENSASYSIQKLWRRYKLYKIINKNKVKNIIINI